MGSVAAPRSSQRSQLWPGGHGWGLARLGVPPAATKSARRGSRRCVPSAHAKLLLRRDHPLRLPRTGPLPLPLSSGRRGDSRRSIGADHGLLFVCLPPLSLTRGKREVRQSGTGRGRQRRDSVRPGVGQAAVEGQGGSVCSLGKGSRRTHTDDTHSDTRPRKCEMLPGVPAERTARPCAIAGGHWALAGVRRRQRSLAGRRVGMTAAGRRAVAALGSRTASAGHRRHCDGQVAEKAPQRGGGWWRHPCQRRPARHTAPGTAADDTAHAAAVVRRTRRRGLSATSAPA